MRRREGCSASLCDSEERSGEECAPRRRVRQRKTPRYTGTGVLSTISRMICSACSDFFSVEA